MRLSQVLSLLTLLVPTMVLSADVAPLPKSVATKTQQPSVSAEPELTAVVNKYYVELKVKNVAKGTAIIWDSFPEDKAETRIIKVEQAYILTGPPGEYRVKVRLVKGEDVTELKWVGKLAGGVTPPQPPPDINPKPVDPPDIKPVPVTSFRVFLVYESADSLSTSDRAVIYGKVVEDWLTANCTGGKAGWRRRDKDAPGENDTAMSGLWAAIQKNVTVTPCVAVEVNGKVEIINTEATPAKMIEKLQSYKGGK